MNQLASLSTVKQALSGERDLIIKVG